MNLDLFFAKPHFGRVLIFTFAMKQFAIPLLDLKEVLENLKSTYVPGSNIILEGIFQLRGKIMPLVNLSILLGLGEIKSSDQNRILVVQSEQNSFAFRVDQIGGIQALERENFLSNSSSSFVWNQESAQLLDLDDMYLRLFDKISKEQITQRSKATS